MVAELISKYIWLIQTISGAGENGLSLTEIIDKYKRRFNQPYSRRSFNNHRAAIADTFGVEIECDRSTNRYSVRYYNDAMDAKSSTSWLINTFTVKNVLDLGKERLSGRVAVEDTPSGQSFLTTIMSAMDEGDELEIEYQKYRSITPETLHVQPFAVKESNRRWYLVGYCHERALKDGKELPNKEMSAWRVYSLDRIKAVRQTEVRFTMPKGFDVDDCFADSYGPYLPDASRKAVSIRFKANDREAKYIRDLPMHPSQVEEKPGDGKGHIFRIHVIPNDELIMDLCKKGDRIEVLEPTEIREKVAKELKNACKIYDKK